RQLGADQAEGAAAGRHHRLGPPGRGHRNHQAGARAGGHAVRRLRRVRRAAHSGLRQDAGRPGRERPRVEPVDGHCQGPGQVLRHREAVQRRHPGQVRPPTRLPRCRGDGGLPRARARCREGRLDGAGQGQGCARRPGHRVVLRADQVRPDRQERVQADVGDPDPGRQGRHRVADGGRGVQVRLARRQAVTALAQATLYGLLQGGLLALVAVGFSLVWGVMNIINVAQGAFVILGAYVAWELNSALGLDPFLGMFGAAAVLFVLGYVVQRGLINLIVNAPIYLTLLLTFGLDLMLVQGMNIAFTADFRSIPTSYAGNSIALGDVRVPLGRLLAFAVAVAVTLLLVAMVNRTRTGLSIMATGMDRGAARLMGIRARHVYALTFGLSAALAGMAGAMVGTVGTFNPAAAG